MSAFQAPFQFNKLWLGAFLLFVYSHSYAEVKVSYGVPEGFTAAEMDDSANYVATFKGRTLPGFIRYSATAASLEFDAQKYAANGISPDDVDTIRGVVSQLDYKRCRNGCDVEIAGYYVTIDKLRRSISIRDTREDYLVPKTAFGLVNNQSVDVRASTDSYRAFNVNGTTWVGLPSQSFGYLSWYVNHTETRGNSIGTQGVSSYYLQKNFASTYVRAGKQNSIDYASGAVSTLLSPGFDHFVTVGSQRNLQVNRSVGSLILYATAEGNYEFYRSGRLILNARAADPHQVAVEIRLFLPEQAYVAERRIGVFGRRHGNHFGATLSVTAGSQWGGRRVEFVPPPGRHVRGDTLEALVDAVAPIVNAALAMTGFGVPK